jgi:hypothetical protein
MNFNKRLTLVLRVDLAGRALEKAAVFQQNPNYFVNLCLEGVLDAMDSPENGSIPILDLYNIIHRRSRLNPQSAWLLLAAFLPQVGELDQEERGALAEFLNSHQGRLSQAILEAYCMLARNAVMQRREFEREIKRLQNLAGPDSLPENSDTPLEIG